MIGSPNLPLIDISSPDTKTTSNLIRQACVEYGFFYVINHGVEDEIIERVLAESKNFFNLPLEEKIKLPHDENHRGYTTQLCEAQGDFKESFYIGPPDENKTGRVLNKWPSEESLPSFRQTMESYHKKLSSIGRKITSLIALALDLEDNYFEKSEHLHEPVGNIRLLHYPGYEAKSGSVVPGTYPHSDFGMLTLLVADNIAGLQICREKNKKTLLWEDVQHIVGAFVVNIGDTLERWTNGLFRSTLHRVVSCGPERYSIAFFLNPHPDWVVECLPSCCSESSPPRFPPIRGGDYLKERVMDTFVFE